MEREGRWKRLHQACRLYPGGQSTLENQPIVSSATGIEGCLLLTCAPDETGCKR